MQELQPLAVADVCAPPRDILNVTSVDQVHLKPAFLENLKQRDPVHTGGFHRHGLHPALLEPVGQCVQILCEGGKASHVLGGSIRGNGDIDLGSANIDARRIQPEIEILEVSCVKGNGLDAWMRWLDETRRRVSAPVEYSGAV